MENKISRGSKVNLQPSKSVGRKIRSFPYYITKIPNCQGLY